MEGFSGAVPVRVSDSSRVTESFLCPMKRFWSYDFAGIGLTPIEVKLDREFGTGVHMMIEEFVKTKDFGASWEIFRNFWAKYKEIPAFCELTLDKSLTRWRECEALARAYLFIFAWKFREAFENTKVHHIETEFVLDFGPVYPPGDVMAPPLFNLLYACRPDFAVEDSNGYFNVNIKTARFPEKLAEAANHDPQLGFEAEGVAEHFKQEFRGSYLLTFTKGNRQKPLKSDISRGLTDGWRRDSILLYAWYKNGVFRPEYINGGVKVPIFHEDQEHIKYLEGIKKQAITQVEIYGPYLHLESMVQDKIDVIQVELMSFLGFRPKNRRICHDVGGFGYKCPFFDLCSGADPYMAVQEGEFCWRTPNHPIEGRARMGEIPGESKTGIDPESGFVW